MYDSLFSATKLTAFVLCALTLLVGQQDGHPARDNLSVAMLVVVIWRLTALSAQISYIVPRSEWNFACIRVPGGSKIENDLYRLIQADL